MGGDFWESVGDIFTDYIAPVALAFIPGVGPYASAAYVGTKTGLETGSPLAGILGAGGSFAGNALGGAIGGELGTSLGSTTGNIVGGESGAELGSIAGNLVGNELGPSLGSFAGNALAENVGSSLGVDYSPTKTATWSPTKSSIGSLPSSLSGLSGLSSSQVGSNIATQGMYGSGVGSEENQYFANLMNNKLIDQGIGSLSPIESSYLSQLGLGGNEDTSSLLKALESYNA
jgi:hypothetical protein